MSQLHTSNGDPVGADEFIQLEGELVGDWSLAKETPPNDIEMQNDIVFAWMNLFAACVRELCAELDISVDVVLKVIAKFQEEIRLDLEFCKWVSSTVENHVVCWQDAMAVISSELNIVRNDLGEVIGCTLVLCFPYLDEENGKANGYPTTQRIAEFKLASVSVA